MIPYLREHKAVQGRVVAIDLSHRELATKRMVPRPLVTLHTDEVCRMPAGKELWWAQEPDGRRFLVHEVRPAPRAGSLITLKLVARDTAGLPAVGTEVCFSIHNTGRGYFTQLPPTDPWTHRPARPPAVDSIEDEEREE
jgi:hypothetical protein